MDLKWLQDRFIYLRESSDLSLRNLSKITGLSAAQLCDLETGRSCNPTIKSLDKLAKAYCMSISDLIGDCPINKELMMADRVVRFIKKDINNAID